MRRITTALLCALALCFSVAAEAQTTFPSPHFDNIQIDGALTGATVTANGTSTTNTVPVWMGYLAGQPNPNPVVFNGLVSGAGFTSMFAAPPAIGGTTPAPGSFSSLNASGAVAGAGFTSMFAAPPAIGTTTPAAGKFSTLNASGAVSGAGFNALLAAPPAIGGTTPAPGSFSTLNASGSVSGTGFNALLAAPPAIGGTTPAPGSFSSLNASGAVAGAGFTSMFAAPPAIGATTPAPGTFSTLNSTGGGTLTSETFNGGAINNSAINGGSITGTDASAMNATAGGVVNTIANWFSLLTGRVVLNNAGLQGLSLSIRSAGTTAFRQGFTTPGDGGAGTYTLSATNCAAADNGAQVQPSSGTGCWIRQPSPLTDIRVWGATTGADIGQYVQKAYNANVGCIFIPPGIWPWSSAVTMAAQPPCFRGAGWNEAVSASSLSTANMTGTWISISSTSFAPVTITAVNGQGGTNGFSHMAFYEAQPAPATGWTPTAYPFIFTLNSSLGRVDFDSLMFYNVTHCISEFDAARSHITNIYGQPLGTCLQFDDQQDVSVLDNVEFWPFWNANANVVGYTQQNVDPILFERSDSPNIGKIELVFAYHSGIAFAQSASGITSGAQIGSIQSDATKYGLWIEPGTTGVQLQVANLRGAGEAYPGTGQIPGSETYRDEGTSTDVSIGNLDCFYAGSNCVDIRGTGTLQFANLLAWNFNFDNNSSVAVNAGASGVVTGANQPSITFPQNGATTIPPRSAGGIYALRGVRQSWTPTIVGGTTAGSATYTAQAGTFWYDGSIVTMTFNLSASASSGMAGNLTIQGLPFSYNTAANQNSFCTIGNMAGIALAANYTTLTGIASGGGGSQILMLENGSGQSSIIAPTTVIVGGSGAFTIDGQCVIASGQ